MDSYDEKIVEIVQHNGRISISDLAVEIGLSRTPCQIRLKRLVDSGIIVGFRADLNYQALGKNHIAFTEVKLSDTREPALRAFNKAIKEVVEVEQCHLIAGQFDYLLKVRTSDIDAYRAALGVTISALPYVASTSTFVVMESIKE